MSVAVSTHPSRSSTAQLGKISPFDIRVAESRADISRFIRLPQQILRDDPCWIAPLELEVSQFLSESHPFRRHGQAEMFLAWQGREPVGRILVSDDPRYNTLHRSNVGCFGMFHCVDDQRVAEQLLNAAAKWLSKRRRKRIIGPIDYSTNYDTGLLIDGFDTPPRVMMNHHPPYYARLLERWGLRKAKDLYAWWFDESKHRIDDTWRCRVDRLAERSGVTVRPIRMNDFDAEITHLHELYNNAWEDNWGFVKMTAAEYRVLVCNLKKIAVPEMILIAEINKRPVGMAITIPDLNEAIAPLNGRLTQMGIPVGLARLMYRIRNVKTARLAVLGVIPRYRRRGVAEMLIQRTFDYGKDVLGYTGAELSWTLEDNEMINRAIARVGGRRYKTYRVYQRDLLDLS